MFRDLERKTGDSRISADGQLAWSLGGNARSRQAGNLTSQSRLANLLYWRCAYRPHPEVEEKARSLS